ncbi:MAG TPA: hypothetical protein VFU21_22995 [Kofleriaceae bacterium]|nr:hypothetical protein [Kofleriaceae bacterium]
MLKNLVAVLAVGLACGGSGKGEAKGPTAGESSGGDLETPAGGGEGGGEGEGGEATEGETPTEAGPPAAVTFVLKNSHDTELAFNMDRGWGINIFAYSGKPPKAKPILMFPKHCTTACDLDEAERCPVCPEPEKVKDIKAAQKMEKVAPGAVLEVPWDGKQLVYSKTKGAASGKSKKCECHAPEATPDGTYTVRACGLRLSTEVGKDTQIQCVEGSMTLPSEEPIRVEFDFGAPPKKPCPKGKKKC